MARGVDKIPSQGDSVNLVIMGSNISKEEKKAYIWGKIVHVDTKSDIRW